MASVRIEQSVWTDPRFVILGRAIGVDAFGAIGRMAKIWAYCTERQTHHLTPDELDVLAAHEGYADAMCAAAHIASA